MTKIIQLVGPSGTGKERAQTTVAAQLKNEGYNVEELVEPWPLRNLAKGYRLRADKNPWTEAAIFTTDRAITFFEKIEPRIREEGLVFLFNRGLADNFVYQGFLGEVGLDFIKKINAGLYMPDLSVCLTVDGQVGYERALQRQLKTGETLSKNETAERIDLITSYYRTLADKMPELNLVFVDTSKITQEEVSASVYEEARKIL